VLYVDDLILTGDDQLIQSCKEDLAREFEMKDMGLMHYFLGIEVWQKDGEVFVPQGKYANEILRRFHMEKCKPMQTPLAGNWRKQDATSGGVVEATIYKNLGVTGKSVYIELLYPTKV
ncbi:reverse transcriptase domain-containing protein, partial [Actinobacillus pleuropneumoniae]|uniref:reverse transcriptase domain-containing protein n=1 Tax=Actinobacillus pleuropneumoniae TaxID=715 RepID=UPI00227C2E3C